MQKAIRKKAPRRRGTRVWAEVHLYWMRVSARFEDVVCETYLIAAPLQTCHEEDHADDAQEPTNPVNFSQNLLSSQASGVHSRRWKVEEECRE